MVHGPCAHLGLHETIWTINRDRQRGAQVITSDHFPSTHFSVLARILFKEGVFNPLQLHTKEIF
jgi:hypothetical protein